MDDAVECEVLYSLVVSHLQLLSRLAVGAWSRGLLILERLLLIVQLHLLRPEMAGVALAIFLLALIINDRCFEWLAWAARGLAARLPLPGARKVHDIAQALCGDTAPQEWRGRHGAAFAIQGLRAKMEDRFAVEEEIALEGRQERGRGVSVYAVYDGHGGDFAAEYTKIHLIAALKSKLKEVHSQRHPPAESEDAGDAPQLSAPPAVAVSVSVAGDPPASVSVSVAGDLAASVSVSAEPAAAAPQQPVISVSAPDDAGASASASTSASTEVVHSPPASLSASPPASLSASPPASLSASPAASLSASLASLLEPGDSAAGGSDSTESPLRSSKSHEAYQRARSPRRDPRRVPSQGDMLVNYSGQVNYTKLMQDVFSEVDTALLDAARREANVAGTTAVLALVDGDQVVVASCGDSRAVLCDARGNAVPLTTDHKPDQLAEKKRITEAGGFVTFNGVWRVNGILATSRALGDLPFKERRLLTCRPDVQTVSVRHHAAPFLLLASDGLWDAASGQEAVQHVRARLHEPDLGARSLALMAYQRGSLDNITVLVVDLRPGQLGRTGSFRRQQQAS